MNRRITLLLIGLVVFILAVGVNAQGITPNPNTPPNPNANISFPPPVYFMRGEMQIYGTANLPGMANYFLEYRPLIIPPSPDVILPEIPWGPISLPSNVPVQNGLLGIWNTFTVADGLYEIRLTVNVPGQDPVIVTVSPLRVENSPSDFALRNIQLFTLPGNLAVESVVTPPLQPVTTEEATTTTGPTVTSTVDANVRAGDDTVYSVVGVLRNGTSAPILGISSRGTGWYYIELPNGTRGFISPSVVTVNGNTSGLQQITPPPRPAATSTPTSAPTRSVTNTPPTTGSLPDLGGALPSLSPNPPSCGTPFNILINLANIGSAAVTAPFLVGFEVSGPSYFQSYTANANVSSGSPINPGGNFVVGSPSPFTITSGGGQTFTVRVYIDANYAITESNEGNNIITTTFVLSGGC